MRFLQILIRLFFFALFLFLVLTERLQLWMGIFLTSLLLVTLFSRIYCGWFCPVNTALKSVTWLKNKLRIKSSTIPPFLQKPSIRIFIACLFVFVLIGTLLTGQKIPALPLVLLLAVIITFSFPEGFWHRYLCPYGALFSIPARKSRCSLIVQQEKCIKCGICYHHCPVKTITKQDTCYQINPEECLVCMECYHGCPRQAIKYR